MKNVADSDSAARIKLELGHYLEGMYLVGEGPFLLQVHGVSFSWKEGAKQASTDVQRQKICKNTSCWYRLI